jgi:hypothetical protein
MTTDSSVPPKTAAGVQTTALRGDEGKKPAKNKGGRPKGRKRTYDFKLYAKRQDAINAMETLRQHMTTVFDKEGRVVKLGDRQAAQYFIDQMFGTAVNRRENVGDPNAERQTVIIMLPPKYSQLARDAEVEIRPAQVVEVSEKSDKTPTGASKAAEKRYLGAGDGKKRSR